MTLPPLPLRVPTYPGETVDSFAHRAAAANHTTITDIEAGLRQQRLLTSRARSHHQRATLWRELGDLPPHAFTTPATLNGHPVPARPLCRHCAGGDAVLARLPQFGLICLHHQCTHDPPHTPIAHLPGLLHAERRFRHLHRTRALVLDSPAMGIARDTARLAYPPRATTHHHSPPIGLPAVMIYRSQVAIAALLTDHTFLHTACSTAPAPHRRRYLATRLTRAVGTHRNNTGRAVQHLWRIIDTLTDYLRAVDSGHRTYTEAFHELLPYYADASQAVGTATNPA
ncbi:hypothetical protein QYF68_04995 [Mycolicibacterium austroafricanum]|uniref:TniQ protein n=1 Tax=Mycolicibacterium austroafricanum TaxID=39687 RepID=A0ABT8H8V1_MYCAO|nr:hypothetical protein [Mycolicibacterium austroafricanum]MDN4517181.1 hypothetical protein [Mycolicibacterium austroafricanum]